MWGSVQCLMLSLLLLHRGDSAPCCCTAWQALASPSPPMQMSSRAKEQRSKGAAEQRSCAAAATHLAPEQLSSQAAEQWSNWDIGQLQT